MFGKNKRSGLLRPDLHFQWSQQQESNPQPTDYKSVALPLSHAGAFGYFSGNGAIKLAFFMLIKKYIQHLNEADFSLLPWLKFPHIEPQRCAQRSKTRQAQTFLPKEQRLRRLSRYVLQRQHRSSARCIHRPAVTENPPPYAA